MKTKDITVEFESKGKLVLTMKRLNAGEMNRLTDESTEIKMVGNRPEARIKISVMKENGIMKSVVKAVDIHGATVALSLGDIQSLDPVDFEAVSAVFEELNSQSSKKESSSDAS